MTLHEKMEYLSENRPQRDRSLRRLALRLDDGSSFLLLQSQDACVRWALLDKRLRIMNEGVERSFGGNLAKSAEKILTDEGLSGSEQISLDDYDVLCENTSIRKKPGRKKEKENDPQQDL